MKNINPRKKICINENWKFHRGDISTPNVSWDLVKTGVCHDGGSHRKMDDSDWETVNLPHDYVVETGFVRKEDTRFRESINYEERWLWRKNNGLWNAHGNHIEDISWYRYHFDYSENYDTKRTYLWLEGVYRNSDIYLNDCFVLNHQSGYTPIIVDISDFLFTDIENVLAIKTDPTLQEGWWYEGGGIYRNAYLITVDNLHIAPNGIFVYTTNFSDDFSCCSINVNVELKNIYLIDKTFTIKTTVYDVENKVCKEFSKTSEIQAFSEKEITFTGDLTDVVLWDIQKPNLYTVKTEIILDGVVVDEKAESFGIREIVFDADKGCIINGNHVKLKGMCMHQDHAGVGVAIPYGVDEYRVDKLIEMSCNAIRSSHNPPSPSLVKICDEKGILMMPENRLLGSTPESISQLQTLVKTFRNNPSVFIWSIANEEEYVQWKPIAKNFARTLTSICHKLDPSRLVTSAVPLVTWRDFSTEPTETILHYTDELDVMGFNYSSAEWLRFHDVRPNQPIIITEDICVSSARGCYKTSDNYRLRAGIYENSKDRLDMLSEHAKLVFDNDFIAGTFIWTAFDYRGEPENAWPAVVSDLSLMDICCFPKDSYYFFRALYQVEPFVKVVPQNWNFAGEEGQIKPVICFTNCDKAELFLNGKSLGEKVPENKVCCVWDDVVYETGELKIVAEKNSKSYIDIVKTSKAPHSIKIESLKYNSFTPNHNCYILNISIIDEDGSVVPYAGNDIEFSFSNGVIYRGAGNGNQSSHENDKAPCRRAFNGYCQAIIEVNNNIKTNKFFTAVSQGLYPATVVDF